MKLFKEINKAIFSQPNGVWQVCIDCKVHDAAKELAKAIHKMGGDVIQERRDPNLVVNDRTVMLKGEALDHIYQESIGKKWHQVVFSEERIGFKDYMAAQHAGEKKKAIRFAQTLFDDVPSRPKLSTVRPCR